MEDKLSNPERLISELLSSIIILPLEGVVGSAMDRAKAEQAARLAATYFGFTNNLRVEGK